MSEPQQHRLALPQGTRIRDFEFHRVLGHGGFGMTYLGWNLALDIPVAIKEYLPGDLATREQDGSVVPQSSQAASDFQWGLERFLDEARTLARFQHPNIVRVLHFFEAHSTAYIVMEYAEGETLSAHIERKGSLQEAELNAILYPLLSALEVVHGADFLHRDIKPGNIVLRDVDGSPVLLDFGAARQAIGAKSRSVTSIVTPGYAPIEQYSSRGRQGAWTDIYALGGVCYRALTGQVPEDATDRVRDDPLVPVAQRCAGRASQELLAAVDWALSVDEGDRPQRVGAWREAMGVETAGQQAHRQEAEKSIDSETADSPVTTPSAADVKDAGRLNRWFKFHCICLCIFLVCSVRMLMMERLDGITLLVFCVFSVLTFVSGSRILHKLWSLIPTHKARTTARLAKNLRDSPRTAEPGKAVGFLFIPLFKLYWKFVAIYGLARALNAKTGRIYVSEVASFIYCCSFVVAEVAELLIVVDEGLKTALVCSLMPIPFTVIYVLASEHQFLGISLVISWFVLWFVMLRQMKNAGRLILQGYKA